MTVKELKDILEELPENKEVCIYNVDDDVYQHAIKVRVDSEDDVVMDVEY